MFKSTISDAPSFGTNLGGLRRKIPFNGAEIHPIPAHPTRRSIASDDNVVRGLLLLSKTIMMPYTYISRSVKKHARTRQSTDNNHLLHPPFGLNNAHNSERRPRPAIGPAPQHTMPTHKRPPIARTYSRHERIFTQQNQQASRPAKQSSSNFDNERTIALHLKTRLLQY